MSDEQSIDVTPQPEPLDVQLNAARQGYDAAVRDVMAAQHEVARLRTEADAAEAGQLHDAMLRKRAAAEQVRRLERAIAKADYQSRRVPATS
jgi:hypothetical protein